MREWLHSLTFSFSQFRTFAIPYSHIPTLHSPAPRKKNRPRFYQRRGISHHFVDISFIIAGERVISQTGVITTAVPPTHNMSFSSFSVNSTTLSMFLFIGRFLSLNFFTFTFSFEGNDWRIGVKTTETIPNPEVNPTASAHDALQFLLGQFDDSIDVLVHRSVPFVKRFVIARPP